MAKVYGQRWQISSDKPLGQGGQGQVFRVRDLCGEYEGECALKRVLNPARHERFHREIEAIRLVQHPNIIKLIDHSALDDPTGEVEKQFLVMPIAKGGDLSDPDRIGSYKGSIDAVVQVGKQLSAAIAAAHAKGVIHRDIKPSNILFTGFGHDVWLTDFGICLLREQARLTDLDEVVGPRSFLAPELEDGGRLEVTPAADVYSLGKVLYYIISGGVILPRERLDEERYNNIFRQGERFQLLHGLFRQMICPVSNRLQTMTEVVQRLQNIEEWEQKAQLLPLSSDARASLAELQLRAQKSIRVEQENRTVRQQETARLEETQRAFLAWLQTEFEKLAAYINEQGSLKCSIDNVDRTGEREKFQVAPNAAYVPIMGLGLCLERGDEHSRTKHILEVLLASELRINVTTRVIQPGQQMPDEAPRSMVDHQLAMIPYYLQIVDPRGQGLTSVFFFSKKEMIGKNVGMFVAPSVRGRRAASPYIVPVRPVSASFQNGVSQISPFRVSEWPMIIPQLRQALQEAMDSFISFVSSGASV
jgi:serine/threonine protein kinase